MEGGWGVGVRSAFSPFLNALRSFFVNGRCAKGIYRFRFSDEDLIFCSKV